jgi:hypothetical protein
MKQCINTQQTQKTTDMEVRSKEKWGMAKLKIKYNFHTVCLADEQNDQEDNPALAKIS